MLRPEMLSFWCLILLGKLLAPSQGLFNLGNVLGLSQTDGLLGSKSGGLLNTGLLGEGGLLGTGLLGSGSQSGEESGGLLSAGNESNKSGLLGTGLLGQIGSGGLLGTGILDGESLVSGLLENGLLGTGILGGNGLLGTGLLGNSSLGEGGLTGNGAACKSTRLAWLKLVNLENVRVSWKVFHGNELVLNLYSKLAFCLPGIFHFLSGSSVETNITSHIALTQDTPGDLKFVIKDCNSLLGGFSVNLQKGFLASVISRLLNSSLHSLVPALLCPLVNIWVSIINIKLQFLNRVVTFGLLGKIQSALANLPVTSGQFVELDLQKSPFPSAFIDWLLQIAGIDAGSVQ